MSYKKYLLNDVCFLCGHIGDDVIMHHIETQGARPDLKDDKNNMCQLCYICHSLLHDSKKSKKIKKQLLDKIKNNNCFDVFLGV